MSWFLMILNIYKTQVPATVAQTFEKGGWLPWALFLLMPWHRRSVPPKASACFKGARFPWTPLTLALAPVELLLKRSVVISCVLRFSSLYQQKYAGCWSLLKNVSKVKNWKSNARFSFSRTPFIWPITGTFSLAPGAHEHTGFCGDFVPLPQPPYFISVAHSITPRLLLMPNSPCANIPLSLTTSFELNPRNTSEYVKMIQVFTWRSSISSSVSCDFQTLFKDPSSLKGSLIYF